MKNIVQLFAGVAAVGLVLSIASHIAGLMGRPGPLGDSAVNLQFGIFAVWIPAMLASKHIMQDNSQKDFWKLALRGCPAWMKYMTYGFGIYGVVYFAFVFLGFLGSGVSNAQPADASVSTVRAMSGHWMIFYCAGMAILYSASQLWDEPTTGLQCPNGHPVRPLAKFCDECGQPTMSVARMQKPL